MLIWKVRHVLKKLTSPQSNMTNEEKPAFRSVRRDKRVFQTKVTQWRYLTKMCEEKLSNIFVLKL